MVKRHMLSAHIHLLLSIPPKYIRDKKRSNYGQI